MLMVKRKAGLLQTGSYFCTGDFNKAKVIITGRNCGPKNYKTQFV